MEAGHIYGPLQCSTLLYYQLVGQEKLLAMAMFLLFVLERTLKSEL